MGIAVALPVRIKMKVRVDNKRGMWYNKYNKRKEKREVAEMEMEIIGVIGILGMVLFMGWLMVDASRRVAHNRRQERRREIGIKCAIQREADAANDVAEGLYKPY